MIVCPNCKHRNLAGTMFCTECGAQLISSDNLVTQNIKTSQMQEAQMERPDRQPYIPPELSMNAWGSLHLLDTGQMLPLLDRNEFTLGRISEGQPIMPDIDLSPYQAYTNGVSRLHAVIKRMGPRVLIMDLGSGNGSYVNGKRLNPNIETYLNHGDIVSLGKLKIQILLEK
jgi:FHA domain-containing protein